MSKWPQCQFFSINTARNLPSLHCAFSVTVIMSSRALTKEPASYLVSFDDGLNQVVSRSSILDEGRIRVDSRVNVRWGNRPDEVSLASVVAAGDYVAMRQQLKSIEVPLPTPTRPKKRQRARPASKPPAASTPATKKAVTKKKEEKPCTVLAIGAPPDEPNPADDQDAINIQHETSDLLIPDSDDEDFQHYQRPSDDIDESDVSHVSSILTETIAAAPEKTQPQTDVDTTSPDTTVEKTPPQTAVEETPAQTAVEKTPPHTGNTLSPLVKTPEHLAATAPEVEDETSFSTLLTSTPSASMFRQITRKLDSICRQQAKQQSSIQRLESKCDFIIQSLGQIMTTISALNTQARDPPTASNLTLFNDVLDDYNFDAHAYQDQVSPARQVRRPFQGVAGPDDRPYHRQQNQENVEQPPTYTELQPRVPPFGAAASNDQPQPHAYPEFQTTTNDPFSDIPQLYRLSSQELRKTRQSSFCPGNFAKNLSERLFPELFGPDHLRLKYSWNGGGILNKTALDQTRKEYLKRYLIHLHPEYRDENLFKAGPVAKINENLRRPIGRKKTAKQNF